MFYTVPQLFALKLLISFTRISTTNSWIKNRVNTLKIVCNMRIIKITIVFPQKTLLLYCLLWENIANATFCSPQFAGHHFAELPLEHCVFSCENWPIAISFSWLSTNGILICTQNSMKYANGSKKIKWEKPKTKWGSGMVEEKSTWKNKLKNPCSNHANCF